MALEKQKREIVDEVLKDIKAYKGALNKWQRLGLDEDELHLAIADREKKRYQRKEVLTRNEVYEFQPTMTAGELLALANKIVSESGEDAQLSLDWDIHYEFDDYYYNGPSHDGNPLFKAISTSQESDKEFAAHVKRSMKSRCGYAENAKKRAEKKKAREEKKRQEKIKAVNRLVKKNVEGGIYIGGYTLTKEELIQALQDVSEEIK